MILRLNFSLNYYILNNLMSGFYVLNLFGTEENKRYADEAGNKSEEYLLKTGFIKKTRAYGISFEYYL